MTIKEAKEYLRRMERDRHKNEKHNKRSYADARELSAMVSLVEYGFTGIARQAENKPMLPMLGE